MGKKQELRPCPMCSGKAREGRQFDPHADGYHDYFIRCADCGLSTARFHSHVDDSHGAITKARAAWNRRSSSDEAEVVSVARYGNAINGWVESMEHAGTWHAPTLKRVRENVGPILDEMIASVASPSGVKAGVTEAMVEAAIMAADPDFYAGAKESAPLTYENTAVRMRRAIAAALGVRDEGMGEATDGCPICAVAFKPDDLCQTDIEMGPCHAACLEGSPLVDLETGDPLPDGSKWPTPYRYDSLLPTPIQGDAK